ncbi:MULTISPECIES: hypothetical protein [unclassified Dysgonomonas]|uniref:hypothetical protein n=1 Tax=unclassified Dysgonomonas TaxID=2630389 RepID=UPI0013ECC6EC|nr:MULTISPECIES: hypothetical protein [unclassified Dysgonomonas]
MRKVLFLFVTLFLLITLGACSSVDGDAKEAAELNLKSLEYIRDNELDKAAAAFEESQAIIARYKGADHFDEFYKAYSNYMSNASDK